MVKTPASVKGLRGAGYGLPLCIAGLTSAGLWLDSVCARIDVQVALGVVAFALLVAITFNGDPDERRQVWLCVAIATCMEVFGSIMWGVYRYRFGNVPLYVPPGHGFVYLTALRLAKTPLFAAYPLRAQRVALMGATAWAVAGLAMLPLMGQRMDLFGAGCLIYFVVFMQRTSRGLFFAAVFIVTSALEIVGTSLHDWTWAVHDPVFHAPVGNPPSVIAGVYCMLDAGVILGMRLLARLTDWTPLRPTNTALTAPSGASGSRAEPELYI